MMAHMMQGWTSMSSCKSYIINGARMLISVRIKINKQIKENKGTVVRRHFEGYAKLFVNLTLELC